MIDPTTDLHQRIWPGGKPVVGVIHLLPLPGSPRWGGSMEEVRDRALQEAEILQGAGFTGLIVENFQDAPFYPTTVPPATVAAMAVVADALVGSTGLPVGVNVLRNDAASALAIAAVTGARFIRVNVHTGSMFTDQGLLHGSAHETLRLRGALAPQVAILADVLVKHATPPEGLTLEDAGKDSWHRGLADGLILTGKATGSPTPVHDLDRLRAALPPEARIWVGSGATPTTAPTLLAASDGLIVGSALQVGGRAGGGVEMARATAFMASLAQG